MERADLDPRPAGRILKPMSFRFIAGSDDFLVQRKAHEEWALMTRSVSDPNAAEVIDGQSGNVEEVGRAVTRFISAVQTVSLFAPEKAVWFKDITFLADTVTGRAQGTAGEVERMQHLLENYEADAVRVLLSAAPVDRRKKAYKWFHEKGESVFLEAGKDDRALVNLIEGEAASAGCSFSGNAAGILVERVGGNTRLAIEETRKLVTFLGKEGGAITPGQVAELVPVIGESDFFEAAEAFFSLNLEWTLAAIQRHFFAGHDARPLITSLQNRNRLLVQLKALENAGYLKGRVSKAALEKAEAAFGPFFGEGAAKSSFCVFTQNPWYLGRLADSLERLTLRHLVEFQEQLREAFLEIVRRPQEQEAVLRATAIRCLSPLRS